MSLLCVVSVNHGPTDREVLIEDSEVGYFTDLDTTET